MVGDKQFGGIVTASEGKEGVSLGGSSGHPVITNALPVGCESTTGHIASR